MGRTIPTTKSISEITLIPDYILAIYLNVLPIKSFILSPWSLLKTESCRSYKDSSYTKVNTSKYLNLSETSCK